MIKKHLSLKPAIEKVFLYNLCYMFNVKEVDTRQHIMVIKRKAQFLCYAYIMLILLLQDLSNMYLVDHP